MFHGRLHQTRCKHTYSDSWPPTIHGYGHRNFRPPTYRACADLSVPSKGATTRGKPALIGAIPDGRHSQIPLPPSENTGISLRTAARISSSNAKQDVWDAVLRGVDVDQGTFGRIRGARCWVSLEGQLKILFWLICGTAAWSCGMACIATVLRGPRPRS